MNRSIRAIAAAALLCASLSSIAAIQSNVDDVTVTLKRGSSNVTAAELADVCAALPACTLPLTVENCPAIKAAAIAKDALTRTTGGNVYKCAIEQRSMVTFKPNPPPPICPPKPADLQESRTCPAPTVGTWLQDRIYTLQPAPACWVLGDWSPASPPDGMCAPIDSDADGVPDSTDQCPTVHAVTPDGCPATPPEPVPLLPAPADITAAGISTSSIRITWAVVTGAAAYSLERCIGATCTTFSQLLCVQALAGTHTSLPANITARYRVRASRDATCGTGPNNLGTYSGIVSGTTFGNAPAPVACAVGAWSAWSGGTWSACSSGSQTRQETRSRTVTTQPANGGTACPVLTETRTARQSCAIVTWTPPTQNTNGSALTDLAGYRVHYGRSATALAQTIQLSNPALTAYQFEALEAGTWFFVLRSYATSGAESEQSNVTSRIVP